jgi:hypothetical protein
MSLLRESTTTSFLLEKLTVSGHCQNLSLFFVLVIFMSGVVLASHLQTPLEGPAQARFSR